MKTKLSILLTGLGLIFTFGCTKYPPASDRLLEDLAVITQYDTKANFNDYHTYYLADKIKKVTDRDTTDLPDNISAPILAQVESNMQARGFTKVSPPAIADLGVDVVYFQNTNIYAYYGGWYGGYYWYDWYYYYPYYPVYYSTYTAGMANIELVDLKNAQDGKLYIRWNGMIRGLVTGSHTTQEIQNAIDQAFIQTPQLITNAQ